MSMSQSSNRSDGLSPENAVLVLIDHQVGMMSIIRDMSVQKATNNVLGLAKSAKTLGLPVVLTSNMEWGINGRIVPEVRRVFADQPIIGRVLHLLHIADANRDRWLRGVQTCGRRGDTAKARHPIEGFKLFEADPPEHKSLDLIPGDGSPDSCVMAGLRRP